MYKDPLQAKAYNKKWSKENSAKKNLSSIKWARNNPERARSYHIKSKYNITQEQYNEILVRQNYVCAICFKPETSKHQCGKVRPLSIDHNHTTGKVRGLLCHKHNMAIGVFEDDVAILENAKQYLIRNN